MAPTNIPFALTPGRANTDVLYLSSKIVIAAFHSGITALTVPFDGNSKDLLMRHIQINRRATNLGWIYRTGDILTIPDTEKKDKDLITEYGWVLVISSSLLLYRYWWSNNKANKIINTSLIIIIDTLSIYFIIVIAVIYLLCK